MRLRFLLSAALVGVSMVCMAGAGFAAEGLRFEIENNTTHPMLFRAEESRCLYVHALARGYRLAPGQAGKVSFEIKKIGACSDTSGRKILARIGIYTSASTPPALKAIAHVEMTETSAVHVRTEKAGTGPSATRWQMYIQKKQGRNTVKLVGENVSAGKNRQ